MAISTFATVLHAINPKLSDWKSRMFARHLLMSAAHWRLDATMLVALMTVESRWRTQAVSRAGAVGLGQLMPGTAASLHVNPRDPMQNISGSARYLGGLMERFHRKRSLAIAAYNAGPRAVTQFGGIPPYYETQHYVVRVLRAWKHLKKTVPMPYASELENGFSRDNDVGYWSPNH
jgi:soluble lytic murein transglycosylase-like protein